MNSDNQDRRWQFSLRSFLFVILIVGPVAGIVGPIILDSITSGSRHRAPQPKNSRTNPSARPSETESYYESGETPLY